ncbi:HET-domain-containing protein [Daldinia caldariorum]|uniref:HET-domain-containing protein n=1 Tax=Daldinia caldariorum TaxID=326644 RepID=UPI0020082097|nr:HET-domain-containing protein [Daldinia caldariorum]KAI1464879.1 HET-domain-containing protein [Daldinia caldariorum]
MVTETLGAMDEHSLCQQCEALFSKDGFTQLLSTNRFVHSRLGTFPNRSACRFCSYLWNQDFLGGSVNVFNTRCLRDLVHPASGRIKPGRQSELAACWVVITQPIRSQYIMGISGAVANLEPLTVDNNTSEAEGVDRIFITVESDTGRTEWQASRPLRLVVPKDSPLASYTNFRPFEWNGLTEEWSRNIKSMLESCRKSHPQCQPSGPRPLPSRLLQISECEEPFPEVRLVDTRKGLREGLYVALSYCWGGPQPLELTKDNLNVFLGTTLDNNSLPQTIKDAIKVTQSLGLSYLWIDALCIIQDDPEDKRREISQMCTIYQNAFVTIAAATSTSVHESFLSNTKSFNKRHATCTVPFSHSPDNSLHLKSPNTITISPVHAHKTDVFPLNKRGWTFQEALLPPRLLVFGDLEPFVRCRTRNVMKRSWSAIDYELSTVYPRRIIDSVARNQAEENGLIVDTKGSDLDSIWREIVEQYTLRQLSYAEDRPLAISGVVDFLSTTFRDTCHFGVWESSSVTGLLWKTVPLYEDEKEEEERKEEGKGRRSVAGLPTWSWMSITGPVDLDCVVYFDRPEAVVEWDDDPSHSRLLISCIVLRGEDVHASGMEGSNSKVVIDSWSDFSEGSAEYHFLPEEECSFLVLARETNGHFLALVAACYGDNVYHRCGVAELNIPGDWHPGPRERIVLL